jgi:hypothetical protein
MPIIHVVTDESLKIRELFLRLNKGVVLTGPEKRNAMNGDVPQVIGEIAKHEFFSLCVSYKDTRGENLNNAAKILSFELNQGVTETKRINLDRMVADHANNISELEFAKQSSFETLDKMSVVFGEKDKLLRSAGSIPAFYWFIRGVDTSLVKTVRPFLETVISDTSGRNRPVLLSREEASGYKGWLRNINDRVSHEERIKLLEASFAKWISSNRSRRRELL